MVDKITVQTAGEGFYEITDEVRTQVRTTESGVLTLFCPHTSCALAINEAYDPSAREDMTAFLEHIAPKNLAFIRHTAEGPDDSPSHMKAILMQTSLQLIIEEGALVLGRWQGIYLTEFREAPHTRQLYLKVMTAPV